MDSITQAVLGAAIGEAILSKKIGHKAAILGGIIATIPDLDVVVLPFLDPLARLSMHRGFSHSILFSFIGSFIIVFVLQRLPLCRSVSYLRLYMFTWLCLFTHMLLDAFTSYGTLLLLPFSDQRVGFDSINVVDPIYTLPMIIGLVGSLYFYKNSSQRPIPNMIGLIISTTYLISTLAIKSHVEDQFKSQLGIDNILNTELSSQAVGIASLQWYGVAHTDDGIYLADYSLIKNEPITFKYFKKNNELLEGLDPELVHIMKWFAKDKYVVHREDENLLYFYNLQVDMQGIQTIDGQRRPTLGYFKIKTSKENDTYLLSSGRHQ